MNLSEKSLKTLIKIATYCKGINLQLNDDIDALLDEVKEGQLVEPKPQLTEEELEKILPKKLEMPNERISPLGSAKIKSRNQAIDKCKQALLSKMRGEE